MTMEGCYAALSFAWCYCMVMLYDKLYGLCSQKIMLNSIDSVFHFTKKVIGDINSG
jgi:hypothetical protein